MPSKLLQNLVIIQARSSSSRPSVSENPAEKRQASKKGNRASKRRAPNDESDQEFKMALKDAGQ